MKCIFIYRRDLRIYDNKTLNYLIQNDFTIIPIFIFNEKQIGSKNVYKSEHTVNFMIESLLHLNKELDNKLHFFYTNNEIELLEKLSKSNDVQYIAYNSDNTYYSIQRDKSIDAMCSKNNIELIKFQDYTLFDINTIKTQENKFYEVYSAFYNNAFKKLKNEIPTPVVISKKLLTKSILQIEDKNIHKNILQFYTNDLKSVTKGGRPVGRKLLNKLKNFKQYETTRNIVQENTSFLGAHLKFGTISVREFLQRVSELYGISHSLIGQILWKEFYINLFINLGFKYTIGGDNYKKKKVKWFNNDELFEKWCSGTTGFPLVDAGMRQLNNIGWMHNRCRMITANFLSLVLHIDWHKGEKYFATKLIDYDVAINNGNWQWSVGLGVDRAQFLRIFNPQSQIENHDNDCVFIKKWVPELKKVPNEVIKKWQDLDKEEILKYSKSYPLPCVDYSKQRIKTIKELYR